jgi:hypothetical protein
MNLRQRVKVNVTGRDGKRRRVLTSTRLSLPRRILKFLFGDFCDVLVLTPGEDVQSVEIHEIKEEGVKANG